MRGGMYICWCDRGRELLSTKFLWPCIKCSSQLVQINRQTLAIYRLCRTNKYTIRSTVSLLTFDPLKFFQKNNS